ncbi:hypothetical protein V2J09_012192 [Rumex salicifolius]
MCILCVIQKWSRRVATMLPWLVIPLIGLWGLSQMLPPPYRFEVTSPRLACIFVLLVTLFWYEVLMPRLSSWRARRNARLRERKRFEALELQKLRKTATRRCRNCLTPYRDQNPGGGKFMCSYCGHISKRPVLDLPLPPGLEISNSGIIKELLGKGGKVLNGRIWSDNSSICPDWLEQGSWAVGGSFAGKSAYSRKNSVALFSGSGEEYIDEKSQQRAYFFPHVWMTSLLKSMRCLWRKLFRIGSGEDASSDADRGMLAKGGENGVTYQESRGEKARRKAEEKRQARLEKELLEEEERKQREEVARLVEERRRLRDEKLEAENRARGSCQREKDRREAEKRRQERRREKDKASSKSNSDVEEAEKKTVREIERKRDADNKTENDRREVQKYGIDGIKGHGVELGHGVKGSPVNNFSRGNAGTRYFDRMKGTFLSSSKAFTGGGFFGKVSRAPALSKDKPNGSVDHFQASANRKEICPPSSKHAMNVDDKGTNHQVNTDPQHKTTPKSWQQLFTQSPVVSAPSSTNVIGRPVVKPQAEAQNSQIPSRSSSPPRYDNPIEFAFSLPFTLPTFSNGSMQNSSGFPIAKDHLYVPHDGFPEEPELFEDPCYVPDPASLLGPVSESLDNFQLDLGIGFIPDEMGRSCPLINTSASSDANRQSPIDSPISRLRASEEKLRCLSRLPPSPKAQDVHPFPNGDSDNVDEKGTWQMWKSPSLVQDGLGYAASQANWISPVDWNRSYQEDHSPPVPQKTMASLFSKDNQAASGTHSPQKIFLGNVPCTGTFGGPVPGHNDDPWLQNTFPPPLSAGEDHFPVKTMDVSQANCWSKGDRAMQASGEGIGNSSLVKPNVGDQTSQALVRRRLCRMHSCSDTALACVHESHMAQTETRRHDRLSLHVRWEPARESELRLANLPIHLHEIIIPEREIACKQDKQDDTTRPYISFGSIISLSMDHLWSHISRCATSSMKQPILTLGISQST